MFFNAAGPLCTTLSGLSHTQVLITDLKANCDNSTTLYTYTKYRHCCSNIFVPDHRRDGRIQSIFDLPAQPGVFHRVWPISSTSDMERRENKNGPGAAVRGIGCTGSGIWDYCLITAWPPGFLWPRDSHFGDLSFSLMRQWDLTEIHNKGVNCSKESTRSGVN